MKDVNSNLNAGGQVASTAAPANLGAIAPSGFRKRSSQACGYSVEMSPAVVATIQRLPHRTIVSIRPTPGTVSPILTVHT
jgi:hypothetical protein